MSGQQCPDHGAQNRAASRTESLSVNDTYHAVTMTAGLVQDQEQAGFSRITIMTVQVYAGCNGPVPGAHALENVARNTIACKVGN